MKIYKSTKTPEIDRNNILESILDSNKTLEEKLIYLINYYYQLKLTPNTELKLIKFLFDKLGGQMYYPRKGDNSERFDALINFSNYICVAEIEIPSTEILDAPRNLLDDYAVVKSRKYSDKKVIPVVICWDLPNKRTDYWNVIDDINKILLLKIKTISVLSLALHYWSNTDLDLENDDYFLYSDNTHMTASEKILKENHIDPKKYIGYFQPKK